MTNSLEIKWLFSKSLTIGKTVAKSKSHKIIVYQSVLLILYKRVSFDEMLFKFLSLEILANFFSYCATPFPVLHEKLKLKEQGLLEMRGFCGPQMSGTKELGNGCLGRKL